MAEVYHNPLLGIAAGTGILTFSEETPGGAGSQNPEDSLIFDPTTSSPVRPAISYNSKYNFSQAWLKLKYVNITFVQQMTREVYGFYPDPNSPPPPAQPNPPIRYLQYESSHSISHTFKFAFMGDSQSPWYQEAVDASASTISPAPLRLKTINGTNNAYYEKGLNSPQPNVGVWSAKRYGTDGGTVYDANGNIRTTIGDTRSRAFANYSGDKWYIRPDGFDIGFSVIGRASGSYVDPISGGISNTNSSERSAFTAPANASLENIFYGTDAPPDGDDDDIYTYSGSYTASFEFW